MAQRSEFENTLQPGLLLRLVLEKCKKNSTNLCKIQLKFFWQQHKGTLLIDYKKESLTNSQLNTLNQMSYLYSVKQICLNCKSNYKWIEVKAMKNFTQAGQLENSNLRVCWKQQSSFQKHSNAQIDMNEPELYWSIK